MSVTKLGNLEVKIIPGNAVLSNNGGVIQDDVRH
jgi:hypothetical protein